jgi:hypothetical protein
MVVVYCDIETEVEMMVLRRAVNIVLILVSVFVSVNFVVEKFVLMVNTVSVAVRLPKPVTLYRD